MQKTEQSLIIHSKTYYLVLYQQGTFNW